MFRNKLLLVAIGLMASGSAVAAQGCQLTLKPVTKGFFLNPSLEKVTVLKAVPRGPEPCLIQANDELLQINEQVIPGHNAKALMAYWEGLPNGVPQIFKVRRAGSVVTVVIK